MALSSSIQSRILAGNVHRSCRTSLAALPSAVPMNRDFQIRFTAGFLALFTATAITLAWINFQKETQFVAPYDGVSWIDRNGGVFADRIEPEGPGARAGIEAGDRLTAVNGIPVSHVDTLVRQMYGAGAWSKVRYSLQRGVVSIDAAPILVAQEHTFNVWLRLIGLIYLGIGLYVLFRRWTAPGSTHFYVFCLVSFVFCSFHFTGKLNAFDRTIYWGNIAANMLQPALLLHFVLTFPERSGMLRKYRWLAGSIYVPGLLLLGYHVLAVLSSRATETLLWRLDRLWMAYLAVYFVGSATVLLHSYSRATRPILRQQLKWLTRGTVLAISPFTVLYVLPYVFPGLGFVPMKLSVVTLGILPLTFGYAIFRYKLMDVDLIFKRGMAYTLAAMAIAGAYFTAIALVGELVHTDSERWHHGLGARDGNHSLSGRPIA
jgi:two-component system NtrC family sensor kinase